jgi:hypothetical protein
METCNHGIQEWHYQHTLTLQLALLGVFFWVHLQLERKPRLPQVWRSAGREDGHVDVALHRGITMGCVCLTVHAQP